MNFCKWFLFTISSSTFSLTLISWISSEDSINYHKYYKRKFWRKYIKLDLFLPFHASVNTLSKAFLLITSRLKVLFLFSISLRFWGVWGLESKSSSSFSLILGIQTYSLFSLKILLTSSNLVWESTKIWDKIKSNNLIISNFI